jgi:tRNA threonylcarbamoyladenosine biosynthesis protein TsaB
MKLISLDASGTSAAVAAIEQTDDALRVVAALRLEDARTLSGSLPALFEELLHLAEWERDEVTALAVGTGPGSWTSLRIALATMKTWAQSRELPLFGVPSYDALALAASNALPDDFESALLLVSGPSRANEIYAKLFLATPGGLTMAQPERICTPREALDTAAVEAMSHSIDSPLVVCGESAGDVTNAANEDDVIAQVDVPAEYIAMHLGLLAAQNLAAGEEGDPLRVEPLYLAPSAAERNLSLT